MSPNASSMPVYNPDGTGAADPEIPIKLLSKRNRIQLSCTHCRHAKLKCDRERPCSQCVKRGRSSECTFLPPVARKRPAVSMQNRLKHLESLVKGAMASQPPHEPIDHGGRSHSPSLSLTSQVQDHAEMGASDASGGVVLGPNDATYIGATHWAAMLDDIEEMNSYFNDVGEAETSQSVESVPADLSLLFTNTGSPATREYLLATLPEKSIMNRLVSRYFNSNSSAMHIIHKPTFQRNYKTIWANPNSAPFSFLALTYSIICLGTMAALWAGEENVHISGTPMEMIQIYRRCCAQCLALSNYTKNPGPYTLETFLLYMECEFILSEGDQMSCYLIISVAVRLALRMGLHREPDNINGKITPHQSEMRRRIWHLLVQMDLLVSFHNGLPSMVQAVKSDTREPRNLQDQDFDQDSSELPPSRPETEFTGMSYTLAKGRLARVFGKIIEQVNLLTLPDYADVMALDQELQQIFSTMPPFLRVMPMDLCITDPPGLIIRRISLAVLYQKSRCILHRRYIMKGKDNVEFIFSQKAAIEASRELLQIQSEVHDAVQPGGVLCKDTWIISSLAMHDLLLAAVIIYLCLTQECQGVTLTLENQRIPNTHQEEMIAALEGSYRIWSETRSMSLDTRKACDVLGNMLKRLNSIFQRHDVETSVRIKIDNAPRNDAKKSMSRLSLTEPVPFPELSVGTIDWINGELHEDASGDDTPVSSHPLQSTLDFGYMPIHIIGERTDTPMDFDWDVFDNHVRNSHGDSQSWPDISFEDLNFGE